MLPKTLKRFCNQEIKKFEDNELIEDTRNTFKTFLLRGKNHGKKPSLDRYPPSYLDLVKNGSITLLQALAVIIQNRGFIDRIDTNSESISIQTSGSELLSKA
jgi:hypothetical protein